MKFLALAALLVSAAPAYAAHPLTLAEGGQITCETRGEAAMDLDAKIYRRGGRYFAQLYQAIYNGDTYYSHDGDLHRETDSFADDVVEVALVKNEAEEISFQQIQGEATGRYTLNVKTSGLSRGVEIQIGNVKQIEGYGYGGAVKAATGPVGVAGKAVVRCW